MKFKKGDKVECISTCCEFFTKGKVYTVRENGLDMYGNIMIETNDKGSNTDGWRPEYFKLIEENKMKTSKEMQLKILDKMKSNIDNNLPMCSGIEYYSYRTQKWHTPEAIDFENLEYRLKPETITLKNGVTIPKPLDIKKLDVNTDYYTPLLCSDLYYEIIGFDFRSKGIEVAYKTKEEAIEASKALFGIE